MQAVTITQITPPELETLIENSINKALSKLPPFNPPVPTDELLTVKEAAKFLSLSVATIYGLNHRGELPSMKRSKRCYFSKIDLINYLQKGRKKTFIEISTEAEQYCKNKKG